MARRQPRLSKLDLLTQNRQHAAQTRRTTADTVTTVTGILRGYTQDPEWRADVEVHGGTVNLPAHAGAYVIDGGVRVQVENGRPTHVLGPTDTPVPDSLVPTTVAEGATPVAFMPGYTIDAEARQRAEDAKGTLALAFTTSTDAPTPADAEGRPENAYWYQVDAEGAEIARWRLEDGIWVDAPLGAVIIPDAYVDRLLANEAFIENLQADIITSDVFQGREFIGGTFTGSTFRGGELEVRNLADAVVFSATPHGGVVIGGGDPVYQNAGPLVTDGDSVWITDPVPVTPNATYGWRFRAQSSPAFTSEQNYVEVIFTVGAAQVGEAITTHGTFPTIGSTQGVIESQLVAPAGASSMRLRYRRPDQPPPLPADQYVQFTDIRITAVAAGTVDIGGSVKAPRGVFNRLEVDTLRGTSGIAWDPSDTGWLTFLLTGDWQQSQGAPRRRKQGTRVWLSGEVVALNPAAGESRPITNLPAGWRPARRLRIPWGWGDSATYVVVETTGTVWSGPNARTTSPGMSLDVITFTTD